MKKRMLSSVLFNIPDICDRVPQVLSFSLDFLKVDGVVHIFQHYFVTSSLNL
jgi:hypothetical protein